MKQDGFGNRIDKIKLEEKASLTIRGVFHKGDMIYIHNKEGCRIATFEVV